jgi:diketogulonate reductase-like aldo/keto reductase
MNLSSTKKLNNGVEMPYLGLGVFKSQEGDEVYNAVLAAIEAGYKHIDTAAIYGNEVGVGRAIKDSGIKREDIFITTKLWNEEMRKSNQYNAYEDSLKRLGVEYVDLYLIHWPVKGKYVESWKVLERIYKEGRARAVGVSNFHIHHLEDVFAASDLVPAVNQVECHPELTQVELVKYCESQGIAWEPWSPLGAGSLIENASLKNIGAKYNKSVAQVILRWGLQLDYINIPKSTSKNRIIENSQIFDFELDKSDMETIFALNINRRTGADPETFTF